MKKGTLKFLGRKNHSLFDTNIKIQDMDNVELVLDSSAIPESGTAKVRSRPTVRHYISSSDSLQGFAVPTPKVPVLPPVNGLKTNGADWLSNGSAISVPDLVEGEILVPPPPSMAPPPPPTHFISPPPDFMADLDDSDLAAIHPPSMAPPKPPSLVPSLEEEEDLSFLKPPSMAPPKPPSTCSSASTSSLSISTPPPAKIPDLLECPTFSPPLPPTERQQKTQKTPPPKPMRLSSMPSVDSPPPGRAPAPPVQTHRASTFNPQNTAKLYNIPKTSILCGHEDRETRPKQILLLEDSGSVNSLSFPNGNTPPVTPPSKSVRVNTPELQQEEDLQELKENLQNGLHSQTPQSQPKSEAETKTDSTQQELNKLLQTSREASPKLQREPIAQVNSNQVKLQESLSQNRKFSPLLDRKLRNLKGSETSGTREGPAASPLALLMAAKERDKQRSSLSRENSNKKTLRSSGSIQPIDSSPNSFIVIPKVTSSSSQTPEDRLQESPKPVIFMEHTPTVQTPGQQRSPVSDRDEMASTNPALSGTSTAASPIASDVAVEKHGVERETSQSESAQDEDNGEELSMPLLPPPPEFANSVDLEEVMASPPTIPPPDPPVKKAPSPTVIPVPPGQGPSLPPKPKHPEPPNLPPPNTDVKPKPPCLTTSKAPLAQPPSSLSASQATLLSILQKKMLEIDHKIVPMRESESSSDDWGSPLSDEETKIPVVHRATPQNKNHTFSCRTGGLDMHELESKVAQKNQDKPLLKSLTGNGPQSKHQYGMTFTVRPGTTQPITLVSKGDSS